ncbi:hypothetical protein PCL1606_22860 [Pseudomonas chlororaphis]|uniref:Uncharacterized protein n=1 Tax=Pseudomonas chlororaphis TaxID=587753 RepID=A0A0D5XY59_9PSED|nr:hypothetical protein PCL1606_22860 [Pseudomonas chlororaphis]
MGNRHRRTSDKLDLYLKYDKSISLISPHLFPSPQAADGPFDHPPALSLCVCRDSPRTAAPTSLI